MIRATCCVLTYHDGRKLRRIVPSDGAVEALPEVEARFVRHGTAVYVDAPVEPEPEAGPEPEPEPEPEPDYGAMTAAQLRAECAARGIDVRPKAPKRELLAALESDDEPPTFEAHGAE